MFKYSAKIKHIKVFAFSNEKFNCLGRPPQQILCSKSSVGRSPEKYQGRRGNNY